MPSAPPLAARSVRRIAGFALAATAALILAACGESNSKTNAAPAAPPPVPAKVMQITAQRVPIMLEAVGQTEGSKQVEVRARVAGILHKRLHNEGDTVRAGAPLFQIDRAPFEIALAQARAQLAQERAKQDKAQREVVRLKPLVGLRAISQRDYDDAVSTQQLQDATVLAAEAKVREAELNLSYTLVTAPVAGITGRAIHSEGSLISTGQDSLLTTINQIQPIWVRFSLSGSDLAKLPEGKLDRGGKTEVRLLLPNGSTYAAKGRLNFTATAIDPQLGTQQLRAEFDNPREQLLPGQFVRVQIVAGERSDAFLVPQTAVLQNEKGTFVFVLDEAGKAALRPVQAGDWVGTDWLILAGLQSGDRVVLDNLLKIRPGTTVTAVPDAAPKPAATAPAAKPAALPAPDKPATPPVSDNQG